jgi:hypothetical protein
MESIFDPQSTAERRRRALLATFQELQEHRELLEAILEHAASQWDNMYRSIVTAAVGVRAFYAPGCEGTVWEASDVPCFMC